MSGVPNALYIKLVLIVFALALTAATLIYTHYLVLELQKKERQSAELYAKAYSHLNDIDIEAGDITFIFENIIKPIDIPLILTDRDDNIDSINLSGLRNIEIDSSLSIEERNKLIRKMLKEMDEIHQPIPITYMDTIILGKIHYGDSELIKKIKYYPYFQIFIGAMFILIGYISFSYVKRIEQSNIWAGMAKETAHQLGTPISSLMGWSEMLKIGYNEPEKVIDIAAELDNDINRLENIAQRFSKIGSKPELKEENIFSEIKKVVKYFERRMPQSGKNVEIKILGEENATAKINAHLFDWVIENLIKNAFESIEGKKGSIVISVCESRKCVEVEVCDTGKGIDPRHRKNIFRPGYSSKKRGWGLGLSLAKRIIVEYHKGKIFLKSAVVNQGAVFKITLKKHA